MLRRRLRTKETFRVTCVWCGAKIRDNKKEDASGICLKCFYQRLGNHLRAQKRPIHGEFVSDR
jgi:hypothetical protein